MAAMGRSRGWAGPIGFAVLLLVGIGCFGTLPWTLGGVEFAGVVERRYEAGDLDLNLLPPSLMGLDPAEQARVDEVTAAGGFVPVLAFGTDELGRGMLARVMLGGGVSLGIGLASAVIAVTIGTLLGGIAGFVGGRVDAAIMRVVDILYGLPYILLVVLISVAADGVIARLVSSLLHFRRMLGL